jgi:D-alanyl-D-alanine carboxypeptidase
MLKKLSVLLVAGVLTACGTATAAPQRIDVATQRQDPVGQALDALVRDDRFPGALAAVREPDGRTRDYTAGVGDLATGSRVPVNGQVRIASNTKMFTSTVVLQLVGEGRIGLDDPVEKYLPGIVDGITVRQLLQQTSGLPDYDDVLITDYFKVQHTFYEPRQLVDAALTRPPLFAPGEGWSYANTNYVLAGLVVQQVTGRPIGEEITRRIIDRLGLRATYWPVEQDIRRAHPHGYWPDAEGGLVDVTEMEPSMGWAAGQLISTPRDLNAFMTALLGGKLLRGAQLSAMKTLVDAPDFDTTGTARYGLGLATFDLSCGGVAWNHGGNAPGYVTRNAITEDGRAATVVVTGPAMSLPAAEHIEKAVDTALCS